MDLYGSRRTVLLVRFTWARDLKNGNIMWTNSRQGHRYLEGDAVGQLGYTPVERKTRLWLNLVVLRRVVF